MSPLFSTFRIASLFLVVSCAPMGLDNLAPDVQELEDSGTGIEIGGGSVAETDSGGAGAPLIQPTGGSWAFSDFALGDTSCPSLVGYLPFNEAVGATISTTADVLFELHYDGLDHSEDCVLDGSEFLCDGTVWDSWYDDYAITLIYDMTSLGLFTSESVATGELSLLVGCDGDRCSSLAESLGISLPCNFSFDWTMESQE